MTLTRMSKRENRFALAGMIRRDTCSSRLNGTRPTTANSGMDLI